MKLTGAQIVTAVLKEQNVDTIFGYPGGNVLKIYDEIYKSNSITHITTSHEQGAAHAADGYARTSGEVGVVIATSGPGATNLVTGIAAAALDSVPLVAITGNVSTKALGKDSFQEVDIMGVTMPVTKHNYIVKDISTLADTLREAFAIAKSNRPGPVLVDIPQDVQFAEFEYEEKPQVLPFDVPHADKAALEKAVDMINFSKRPFIYAGGGVIISKTSEYLIKLAEKTDAPVGTSMMGLSAVPRNHESFVGMTGMHGRYAATTAMFNSDLIIAIGTRFSDRATGNKQKFASNVPVLHIDIDNAEINKNVSVTHKVVGDLREILPYLAEHVSDKTRPQWREEIKQYKEFENARIPITDGVLTPKLIIETIGSKTSDSTPIATDVGQHQMWTAQFYDFKKPGTFLTSGGLGAMGYGLGAAIGASLANDKKTTVLITGDGSFHMNLCELATAVTEKLPIKIFVLNNHALGMVRQWQTMFYDGRYSETVSKRKTDFAKVAEAFGAKGYSASTPEEFFKAADNAFSDNGVCVVDCKINFDENVLPMIPPGGSLSDIIM